MEMNYYNQVMAISTITSQLSGTAVHTFPLASALSSSPPSSSPPFRSPSQQQQQYWKDNHIHASNNILPQKNEVLNQMFDYFGMIPPKPKHWCDLSSFSEQASRTGHFGCESRVDVEEIVGYDICPP